ncbi:hypothetical protein ACEPAF_8787 [Sanghuangporus sanghuang]
MESSIATPEEPEEIIRFRLWFRSNGGIIHDDLYFFTGPFGLSICTRRGLPSGVIAATCPFSLAITLETIQEALDHFCRLPSQDCSLTPRQLICAYIGLHYTIGKKDDDENCLLRHRPYIDILPKAETLLTPLYFSEDELDLFRGTNVYGATLDQSRICMEEYRQLREAIGVHSPGISEMFTFDMYKLAWTYLSSRAFPSTLLSSTPSLEASPLSYPVLIPGVDAFNHRRAHPVSWSVSRAESPSAGISTGKPNAEAENHRSDLCVSLVLDTPTAEGEEVFNNYGPKPNSSLILAYGFALADNPDDTIFLKVGSSDDSGRSGQGVGHEVGRNTSGAQAVWDDVRRIIHGRHVEGADQEEEHDDEQQAAYDLQIDMETAGILTDMVSSLMDGLPDPMVGHVSSSVRKEVLTMWRYYVQGQKDILESLLYWLQIKAQEAVRRAEELGISIVRFDSDDE